MSRGVRAKDPAVGRHSFVVRIWREEDSADWRGWVQHTRSGEATAVQDLNGLLAFVEHRAGTLRRGTGTLK